MSRVSSELAFLARALKAPRIGACAPVLAKRAAEEGWDHETYLAAVLAEEVTARETHGGQHRVKAARFPQVKTLDDFDFAFQRSVKRQTMAHLAQLDFLSEAKNVIFLGPPGTGKPTSPSPSVFKPRAAATGSRSPRPTTGSAGSPPPNAPASSKKNSNGSAGSRSSSSTRWATSDLLTIPGSEAELAYGPKGAGGKDSGYICRL